MKEIILYSSTKNFGKYIIENTILKDLHVKLETLIESDANRPNEFYKLPDKVKKILFLDAADAIITVDSEPVLVIEESHEAGTGHNVFQRFPRMAAAIESNVPYLYIYPEAAIVDRQESNIRWDSLNPLIFKAIFALNHLFEYPALIFYYPSLYGKPIANLSYLPNKGLLTDDEYLGCPEIKNSEIKSLFEIISDFFNLINQKDNVKSAKKDFAKLPSVRNRLDFMQSEYVKKLGNKDWTQMSPLSACTEIDTSLLLEYFKRFEDANYNFGSTLRSKQKTIIYKVDAKFRGDPYPGCLAAIDYLSCRYGPTTEDRTKNIVMLWGDFRIENGRFLVIDNQKSRIGDFISSVQSSESKSLLRRKYSELKNYEIPRYYMQVRYGTTFTKTKHIRVYSYFADAIIFPDGSLWKD